MANRSNVSNRGFASMDEEKRRSIASEGGRVSGGRNLDGVDRSKAGKKGAEAQPREAKARGGRNSSTQ